MFIVLLRLLKYNFIVYFHASCYIDVYLIKVFWVARGQRTRIQSGSSRVWIYFGMGVSETLDPPDTNGYLGKYITGEIKRGQEYCSTLFRTACGRKLTSIIPTPFQTEYGGGDFNFNPIKTVFKVLLTSVLEAHIVHV